MSNGENLRRSSRIKALTKENRIRRYMYEEDESMSEISSTITNKDLEDIEEDLQKPVELFSDDDVSGKRLYGFNTPVRKSSMTEKANQYRTPVSMRMANTLPKAKVVLEKLDTSQKSIKTPNTNKKTPQKHVPILRIRFSSGVTSSESESISEPSDYMPTEDESEEDTSDSENMELSNDETDGSSQNTKSPGKKVIRQMKVLNLSKRVGGKYKCSIVHKDYHMKVDEYFETQSEKAVTSDRTLERLRNSRLTKEKLEELLANQNSVSTRHKKILFSLTENHTTLFPMWHFIMEEGYTVLLHGLGSKRCLINEFHKLVIRSHPTLVVNGFFPSLAMKDILDGIIEDLLGLSCSANPSDCIDLIEKIMKKNPKDRLYLLIHNIDGIMLRSNKSQDVLSCLASIPNVCVLASVDHINAPLLWDHVKRSKFNFFWWDTTTFLPYQEETSYESSLLVQQSDALALSSLHNVFLSLTSNAKSIYILLAKNQLSNSSNATFTGMAFKDLYRTAREGFLVSSDLALRAQLTEFIDHKLVKIKRTIDGAEHLMIPLSNGLLKQFLEVHEK